MSRSMFVRRTRPECLRWAGYLWAAGWLAMTAGTSHAQQAGAPVAAVLSFGQAFEAAQAHDPAYRAAGFNRDAGREALPIAQGSMLPQLGLVVSNAETAGTRRFSNSLNQPVEVPLQYSSPQVSLTMRWPLLHLEGLAAIDQARAQVELAEAQYRVDGLNLLDRVTAAYLEHLAARASERLADQRVAAAQVTADQARRREAGGEGTRVLTARDGAAVEIARSARVEAASALNNARENLTRLTGLATVNVPDLPAQWQPVPLVPDSFDAWLELADRQNPLIRAREWALASASAQVRREWAGHAPRIDLVGSISQSRNDGVSTIGQESRLNSVGLQLQLPLFTGGTVSAMVRQAKARERAAEEELQRERDQLRVDLYRFWEQIRSLQERVRSLSVALDASTLALRGSVRAREEGVSTLGDYAALQAADLDLRRQLVQARLDLLLAHVRLRIRAGLSPQEVVRIVDELLPSTGTTTSQRTS